MSDTEEDSLSGDNWLVNVEWIHDFLRDYHKTKEKFVVNVSWLAYYVVTLFVKDVKISRTTVFRGAVRMG